MSTTPNEAVGQDLPADQQRAAEHASLTPSDDAAQADAGTPHYGTFGKKPADTHTSRSGSNDNPDEFSEIRTAEDAIPRNGTTDSGDPNPYHQTGYVQQNRDPESVREVQQNDQAEDNQRAAWADDDMRYAGGHAKASWQAENDKEHDNND